MTAFGRLLPAIAGTLWLLVSGTALAGNEAVLQRWVGWVAERNAIAHDVAASKYPAARPIEDPQREAEVLDDKRRRALRMGLDPEPVVAAYRQFIEANKLLQYVDVQRYRLGTTPPPAPPLGDIRRRIDGVDQALLGQWSALDAVRADPHCEPMLAQAIAQVGGAGTTAPGIALVRALVGFCAPPRWFNGRRSVAAAGRTRRPTRPRPAVCPTTRTPGPAGRPRHSPAPC